MYGPLRHVTMLIIVLVALFLAFYDVIPFKDPGRGDTISEIILFWALRCFSLPYTFGVLAGHFFIPRDGGKPRPIVLITLLALIIVLDVVTRVCNIGQLLDAQKIPFIAFAVGVPIGPLFWPQQRKDKL